MAQNLRVGGGQLILQRSVGTPTTTQNIVQRKLSLRGGRLAVSLGTTYNQFVRQRALILSEPEPEPEPETPTSGINQSLGSVVERIGGGGGNGNYDQSDEETILAVIQAFMSCQ